MIKEHTYSNSGIFNVSLKLIDNLNDISTTYYLIEVINSLPEVNFTINPETGNTLTMFEFNDLSFDSDGDIEEWLWNFGDGNSSTEEKPYHYFSYPGYYNVTLTLKDDQNGFNSSTILIYVENSPPDPDIRIDEGIFVGQNNWKVPTDRYIRIDAGESTDNDNNLLYYEWKYNGELIEGQYIDLIFSDETYILDLTVSDPRGGSATEKFTLTGTNVPTLTLNHENLDIVVLSLIHI